VLQLVGSGAGPTADQQEAVRREVAPTDRETLAQECQEDAALGKLVDLVRGEPLADAERERWQGADAAPAETPSDDSDDDTP
jgi:hypothetical protein